MHRIDDLEHSLMTLAKFVKEETNKLKAENENINKRIASAPNNKIVEMEAKINDIWKKIAALSPQTKNPKKKEKKKKEKRKKSGAASPKRKGPKKRNRRTNRRVRAPPLFLGPFVWGE